MDAVRGGRVGKSTFGAGFRRRFTKSIKRVGEESESLPSGEGQGSYTVWCSASASGDRALYSAASTPITTESNLDPS